MKRFIAFILAVFLMPVMCINSSAEEISSSEYENMATGLLRTLEVIDEEYNCGDYITRNEFSVIICRLAGITVSAETTSRVFSDVSEESEYAPYIKCISDMGLISGYSDNTFRGEENISVMETLTVLIRLLGYSEIAAVKGGYPTGYVSIAKQLKLLSGTACGFNGIITKGELAVISANALEREIYSVSSVEGDSVVMEASGVTLLKSSFGISVFDGIVEATEVTRLMGDAEDVSSRFIIVGEQMILSEDVEANEFLGYSVKAYCEEKASGMFCLRFISLKPGENEVTEIKISEIDGIEDYNILLMDENGKIKKYPYGKTSPVIYNGISTTASFEYGMLSGAEGAVKLLDNTGDGKADVVFVDIYTDITVGAIDNSSFTVYDMYDKNNKILLDTYSDNPYVLIYNSDGMEIPFNVIKKYSVISIEKTLEDSKQTLVKAYVSDHKLNGKIEAINRNEDGVYITVNGTEVELTTACGINCKNEIEVGRFVEAGINVYGKCAYIKNMAGEFNYGYIVDAGKEDSFEGKILVKILTPDVQASVYYVSDKTIVDGKEFKNHNSEILTALNKGAEASLYVSGKKPDGLAIEPDCYCQTVRYRIDSDGNIDYIDTVLNTSSDGFVPGSRSNADGDNRLYMYNGGTLRYKINGRNLDGKIVVPANSLILRIPDVTNADFDYTDVENYKKGSSTMFADNGMYNVSAFFDGGDKIAADFFNVISVGATGWLGTSDPLPVFVKKTIVVTPDGEVVKKITLLEDGKTKELLCDKDIEFVIPEGNEISGKLSINDLKPGDLISYIEGKDGYMTDFELNYRAEDDMFIKGLRYDSDFNSAFRLISAYVGRVEEDGFEFKVTDDISEMENDDNFEVMLKPSCKITIYDGNEKGKNKVRSGSFNDFIGYDKANADCTKIIMQQRYSQAIMIYIIR